MLHYRHEAFFYEGQDQFLEGTAAFIGDGLAAGEPILAVLDAAKIDALKAELAGDAQAVLFADMATVGANPARIIPAWQEFIDEHGLATRRLRGIGEPIWPGRSSAEMAECHRHEALLNVAFGDVGFWLLCPYDTSRLQPGELERARHTHPFVCEHGVSEESAHYSVADCVADDFSEPLPPAPQDAAVISFKAPGALRHVRRLVAEHARRVGMSAGRSAELMIAVSEIASNSLRHGGGQGRLLVWQENGSLICEVRDHGHIDDPLVDRRRPAPEAQGGYGLWLTNQLCELVQLRTSPQSSVLRLHVHL
jgi:anti-sigma regulatory factor (Ser/Thr protein kinase)